MLSTGLDPTRPPRQPSGSAWRAYGRLVGYSLRYKGRLAISIFFALVIAASFGAMLYGVGTVIDLTFYKAETHADGALVRVDPADKLAANLHDARARVERYTGWQIPDVEPRFRGLVEQMRAHPMRALAAVCALVLGLSLLIAITRFFQEYFAGTVGARVTTDLGEAMYENLMRQPVGFFELHSSGEILSRFTNDIFMVDRGLSGVFVKLMREPIKIVMFIGIAISVDAWLTLVGVCVLPPVAYVLIRIGKKVRKSTRRSLEKIASMATVVNETVDGIMIVKGYCMEDYETRRVRGEIIKLRRLLYQMSRLNALTGPLTEFILIVGVVAFVMLSGQRVAAGQLSPGDLTALYVALAMTLDPVRKLSSVNNMIQTSVASAERIFQYIDMRPNITEASQPIVLPPFRECLRFEGVRFAYDGKREVLRGISLDIRKGELVALVGFSGAGKSTLVKLIPRFYDVTDGRITFDGVDIRQASFQSLRDQISIVTQDTLLFAESIRDNIAFGRTQYSEERVREAAVAANAHEFIERLPKGYDTVLGEGGASLSGGQRQRLAIARAIIKDPAILILDEATSSLDSESERLIQDALDHFITGRTAIVIAHRLSTIKRAGRIVVMDDGGIAEVGTHQELLEHGGMYRRLYETQFGPQEVRA